MDYIVDGLIWKIIKKALESDKEQLSRSCRLNQKVLHVAFTAEHLVARLHKLEVSIYIPQVNLNPRVPQIIQEQREQRKGESKRVNEGVLTMEGEFMNDTFITQCDPSMTWLQS